jgi:hypothetical protein
MCPPQLPPQTKSNPTCTTISQPPHQIRPDAELDAHFEDLKKDRGEPTDAAQAAELAAAAAQEATRAARQEARQRQVDGAKEKRRKHEVGLL